MKTTIFILMLISISFGAFSQSNSTVDYYNWSNPNTFKVSPAPLIKGFGLFSDSLSKTFNGKTFYEHNNQYYAIESWADYYYWFTKEYSNSFRDPQLYEYYYHAKDDYGMASYIAGNNYTGKYYPTAFEINFADKPDTKNRLNSDKFIAANDPSKIAKMEKQLNLKNGAKKPEFNEGMSHTKNEKPEMFNKEDFYQKKLEIKQVQNKSANKPEFHENHDNRMNQKEKQNFDSDKKHSEKKNENNKNQKPVQNSNELKKDS